MDDLHSIAYGGCTSSLGWDHFHNLGVFNSDTSHFMDSNINSTPPFFSPLDSDPSTGYLQDALFEFSSKRRRLLLFSDDRETESPDPIKNCWKYWNQNENSQENFGYLSYINNNCSIEGKQENTSLSGVSEDLEIFKERKEGEEGVRGSAFDSISSSSSSSLINQSISHKEALYSIDPISPYGSGDKRKKKVITRVVYPFALVKPGGIEGDVTLNDINERILMPPTRPVRHPVGDFACRPIVSPDGPGLSGKSVVALTKIQTQGRGTITIIRTKG
ncbi:hypothetical protein LguiA_031477 [Lonicera macranthoides]